jgi:CIC family chloride channel protein
MRGAKQSAREFATLVGARRRADADPPPRKAAIVTEDDSASTPKVDPSPHSPSRPTRARWRRDLAAWILKDTPVDVRILGRTLLHAIGVGIGAGIVGAAFLVGLDLLNRVFLEHFAGYVGLKADGEASILGTSTPGPFRPWMLAFLPAIGALISGLITTRAPEARGGGGDAMIEAYHHRGGVIRPRVLWVKWLASVFTLGLGGSGGREGPTMHIGAGIGSAVGSLLHVNARERRVLMVAGVAVGMSAVFRTPLGAALLAIEVLYRDDFEAEALIPTLLASVVAYSVVVPIFGQATMFAHAAHYPFRPSHLPLYALLSLAIACLSIAFVKGLRGVDALSRRMSIPRWFSPAIGGLALGLFAVPIIILVGERLGTTGKGLGILGSGYGAAQMAIVGNDFLPGGWYGVQLLLLLCAAKLVATSLTIGSGGSAGDFAPSLVLGGLFGGAFGRAVQILSHDPSIDPGAFALVGMGTFYGGIAHAPISALIMVSELAGSYELLVPMMLAGGIAFVVLRKHSLYAAQIPSRMGSPVHAIVDHVRSLERSTARDVLDPKRRWLTLARNLPLREILRSTAAVDGQSVFPVLDESSRAVGLISIETLRLLGDPEEHPKNLVAADLMQRDVSVALDAKLRVAAELMRANELRQIPVVGEDGRYLGLIDEAQIVRSAHA